MRSSSVSSTTCVIGRTAGILERAQPARSSPTRTPREFTIGAATSASGTAAARPSSERTSATPAGGTARSDAVAHLERQAAPVGEADREHALGPDLRHQPGLGPHQLGVDRALERDELRVGAHRRGAAVAGRPEAAARRARRTRGRARRAARRTCASRSRPSPPRSARRRRTPPRRSRASRPGARARRGSSRRAASPRRGSGPARTRACPSSCGGSATAATPSAARGSRGSSGPQPSAPSTRPHASSTSATTATWSGDPPCEAHASARWRRSSPKRSSTPARTLPSACSGLTAERAKTGQVAVGAGDRSVRPRSRTRRRGARTRPRRPAAATTRVRTPAPASARGSPR